MARGNDVSNLVFRDIQMKDVKNALIISEYYPRILPAGGVSIEPVTRLTPHFHDITIENLTATGIKNAGAIVGLPEDPVASVVLKNVQISAQKGLSICYAHVTGSKVLVQAEEGKPITQMEGAEVSLQ